MEKNHEPHFSIETASVSVRQWRADICSFPEHEIARTQIPRKYLLGLIDGLTINKRSLY